MATDPNYPFLDDDSLNLYPPSLPTGFERPDDDADQGYGATGLRFYKGPGGLYVAVPGYDPVLTGHPQSIAIEGWGQLAPYSLVDPLARSRTAPFQRKDKIFGLPAELVTTTLMTAPALFAAGGAFPGIDLATGAAIPAGQTGLLSQLGFGAGGTGTSIPVGEAGFEVGAGGTDFLGSGGVVNPAASAVPTDFSNWENIGNEMVGDPSQSMPYQTPGTPTTPGQTVTIDGVTTTVPGSLIPPGGFTSADIGAGGAAGSAASVPDWLKNIFPNTNWASILAGGAKGVLDYLAGKEQRDALEQAFNQQWGAGAWARDLNRASYGPGFDLMAQPGYGDAFGRAADIAARSYSSRYGNPADSPTAQAGILNDVWSQNYLPALSNYRGGLLQAGGLGLNTSGQIGMAQAQQAGFPYTAIGTGIGAALNPSPSWDDILKRITINVGTRPV